MNVIVPFSQFIGYIFYAILAGYVFMQFVKEENKPKISVPRAVIGVSALGIILLGFLPILELVLFFKGQQSFLTLTGSVLMEFHAGKAWLITACLTFLFWVTFQVNGSKYIQALWVLLMILTVGYGSHAATENFWSGFFSHSVHFLAVTLWAGILIQTAWFSANKENWSNFLQWFHSFAIGCVILITVSGITLMTFVTNELTDYPDTWIFTYGQMLLLKHISIIPILAFAYINGVLSKKSLSIPTFNPKPWVKVESIILLFAFFFTGVMGTQNPPHTIRPKLDDAPYWIDWFTGVNVTNETVVHYGVTLPSLVFVTLALVCLGMLFASFKKANANKAILLAIGFILSAYLGIMFAMSI